jgi:hypothetical protein
LKVLVTDVSLKDKNQQLEMCNVEMMDEIVIAEPVL